MKFTQVKPNCNFQVLEKACHRNKRIFHQRYSKFPFNKRIFQAITNEAEEIQQTLRIKKINIKEWKEIISKQHKPYKQWKKLHIDPINEKYKLTPPRELYVSQ
ncbi:hypothetical protein ABPG72_004796 [Tetrahymena utriculariae]